jgi:hypothetical protein
MSESLRSILASVAAVTALVPLLAAAQRPPDLSGDWVLVSATSSGGGGRGAAGETETRGDHRVTSNTASGAAFNCGRGCRIVHKGQTLRIDDAYLGSNDKPAPPVILRLDGRQGAVIDSFNPGREIQATAQTPSADEAAATENPLSAAFFKASRALFLSPARPHVTAMR